LCMHVHRHCVCRQCLHSTGTLKWHGTFLCAGDGHECQAAQPVGPRQPPRWSKACESIISLCSAAQDSCENNAQATETASKEGHKAHACLLASIGHDPA
jgi:hypothetical protein